MARKVYLDSNVEVDVGQRTMPFPKSETPVDRKTNKQLIYGLLDEAYPRGYTANESLDRIRTRWNPGLKRTTLSPQLSRLKAEELIFNESRQWKLIRTDAPSDNSDETFPSFGMDQ